MAEFVKKYNPDRSADWNYGGSKWRLSRSKIDFFIECPRCFYIDNKLGTKRPSFPSFNLNIAVDELFKKEFDIHRKAESQHPIMQKYQIEAVPYAHKDLPVWRDAFAGIEHTDEVTGLTISGAVDDIWVTPTKELIIVDYKSTSKEGTITDLSDSPWDQQYKRQLGVYKWLFEQNGFSVSDTGFLVYANANKAADTFADKLTFQTTLVPVALETEWIPKTLVAIKQCLENDQLPPIGHNCEYCPYREAAGKKLLKIHQRNTHNTTTADQNVSTTRDAIKRLKKKYA